MKQFLSHLSQKLNSQFTFPFEGRFALALKAFTYRENQIFFTAMGVLVGTTIVLLIGVSQSYMVEVPAKGGTLIEGVLNTPAHINPLLATSEVGTEADRDLSSLIYSGLLRADENNGFIPDLAESYKVSKDGLVYTFTLKPNLVWHDGKKITAADVVFTIKTAQDGRMKSPKRASWDGVGVEQTDDLTVRFTLAKPYSQFLDNATMGILPKHIWENIDFNRFDTNKYNREPIGSGPYKFDSVKTITKDGDEIPVSYTLKSFNKFALGEPLISTIKFVFFGNEGDLVQALKNGTVESINSVSSENARILVEKGYRVERTPLPRVLAVFFNQSEQPIFTDAAVRKALGLAVDKASIINKVLSGYGVPLDSPLPPGTEGYEPAIASANTHAEQLDLARATLEKAGWKYASSTSSWTKTVKKITQTLSFDLTTSEASELKAVAQELKNSWAELGIPVNVRVFATGDLKETIVRPRKFDALFFGQVLQGGDPYPFWHSSQRLDPGLNVTSYANTKVDGLLDNARTEISSSKRTADYEAFSDEVKKDNPAIFMYAPDFLYVLPKNIHGLFLGAITVPSDRFLNAYKWYINTDNVWKIFAPSSEK